MTACFPIQPALPAPALIKTIDNDYAIVDLAPLQQELADCGRLTKQEAINAIIYWLVTRYKLGVEFVKRITEVKTPADNIDWRVPEWLIKALRTFTGTCVVRT